MTFFGLIWEKLYKKRREAAKGPLLLALTAGGRRVPEPARNPAS